MNNTVPLPARGSYLFQTVCKYIEQKKMFCDKPYYTSVSFPQMHYSPSNLAVWQFLYFMKVLLEYHRAHQSPSPEAAQGSLQSSCISNHWLLHPNQTQKAHCIHIQIASLYKIKMTYKFSKALLGIVQNTQACVCLIGNKSINKFRSNIIRQITISNKLNHISQRVAINNIRKMTCTQYS